MTYVCLQNYEAFALENSLMRLYFRTYFFVTSTSKDLTIKEVLMCFVFY